MDEIIKAASVGASHLGSGAPIYSADPLPSDLPDTIPFFVYGTLTSGFANRENTVRGREVACVSAYFVPPGHTQAAMYHFDDAKFPGLYEVRAHHTEPGSATKPKSKDAESTFFSAAQKVAATDAVRAVMPAQAVHGQLLWFNPDDTLEITADMDALEGFDPDLDAPVSLDKVGSEHADPNMYVRRLRWVTFGSPEAAGDAIAAEHTITEGASTLQQPLSVPPPVPACCDSGGTAPTTSAPGAAESTEIRRKVDGDTSYCGDPGGSIASASASSRIESSPKPLGQNTILSYVYFCRIRPGMDLKATPVTPVPFVFTGGASKAAAGTRVDSRVGVGVPGEILESELLVLDWPGYIRTQQRACLSGETAT